MFIGRVCLSLVFLFSFVHKIFNWDGSYNYLKEGISYWVSYTVNFPQIQRVVEQMESLSPILLLMAAILEGLGGILVLLGVKVKTGALLLILFLIPVTFICHPFWLVSSGQEQLQMVMFLKNIGILGGLFILVAQPMRKSSSREEEE